MDKRKMIAVAFVVLVAVGLFIVLGTPALAEGGTYCGLPGQPPCV